MWRPVESERGPGRPGIVDDEELLALFEGMDAAEEGRAAVFRYLVALLLLRKRLFRVVDQRVGESGRPVLQIARRGGPKGIEPEIMEVVDPGMDEAAVAEGIAELGAVLGAGGGGNARGAE
jgi:hypothetical protein